MASDIDAAILINSTLNNNQVQSENESTTNKNTTKKSNGELPHLKTDQKGLDLGEMKLEEAYALTREFIKAKEGTKAIQMSYDDRNMMNVLCKQVKYCKFDPDKVQVGFLDLVGKDRLQLWKSLGDLSKEEAMTKYINLIAKVCPLFHVHFEAHKRHLQEIKQKLFEEEERKRREMAEQKEKKLKEEDLKLLEESKKRREEIQRKQIQEALNQQTYPHFKAYAEQQHPNNALAQEELIKQLQEQHFEQYMNQVYQQQLLHQQQQAEQLRAIRRAQKKQEITANEDQFKKLSLNNSETNLSNISNSDQSNLSLNASTSINLKSSNSHLTSDSVNLTLITENENSDSNNSTKNNLSKRGYQQQQLPSNNDTINSNNSLDQSSNSLENNNHSLVLSNSLNENNNQFDNQENEDEEIELPPISAASMLTRKDIKEFKESVKRDNDAIIRVGSGETVTVRVPTHEDGRLIFWEFATDYYDIGFGLHFEWTISPSNNVTVHVSETSEEEEGEDEEGEESTKQDVEKGDKSNENKPPCDEIIPIFRRDCHEEVYAGSHLYPGRGVYLLKFDNSYSLWRSKTLYYRVYYSK